MVSLKKIILLLLLIFSISFLASCTSKVGDESTKYVPSGKVINRHVSDVSVSGCYAVPEHGTWFCTIEVRDAVAEYLGQDVNYFLAVDIMSNGTQLDVKSDEMISELERLAECGYHVGYSEAWEYQGAGGIVYYTYIAGCFTADELENFVPSENYGYSFRFAVNGDSSPVPAEQGIVTSFRDGDVYKD